jgi:hypothetical protein
MERVRKCIWMGAMLGGVAIFAERGTAQNLLANPSFEDPITFDGAPFVGFWEGFSNGGGATAANATTSPRTGAQNVTLNIPDLDNNFAGVFQEVQGLVPGQQVLFTGFYRTPAAPLTVGSEFRIEWRNSVANTGLGATPNVTTPPTDVYTQFSLGATVPAGADAARVVYAIQTFGGTTNTGTVFIDDFSFTVPEPTSVAALGFGGLVVSARRRRVC